jgi:hypothetical protein
MKPIRIIRLGGEMKKQIRKMRLGEESVPLRVRDLSTLLNPHADQEAMVKSLKDSEVSLLIDAGAEADAIRKEKDAIAKAAKALLREHARLHSWKTRAGNTATCSIKPSTSTKIDPVALLTEMKRQNKQTLFGTVFSVLVGKAKEYLGRDLVDQVAEEVTEEYGSVSLKQLK